MRIVMNPLFILGQRINKELRLASFLSQQSAFQVVQLTKLIEHKLAYVKNASNNVITLPIVNEGIVHPI